MAFRRLMPGILSSGRSSGTTIGDITSAIHAYEPANVVGSSTATGWTDSVGSNDMANQGTACSIDGDGGVVYVSGGRNGLYYPIGNADAASTVFVTFAYNWNAVTDARIIAFAAAGGGHILRAVDTSGTAGYDAFWSDSRTLYGTSTYTTPTQDQVHTEFSGASVLTIAFDRTTNWGTTNMLPFEILTGTDVTLYGSVWYTDSGDRSTAEDWATGILP